MSSVPRPNNTVYPVDRQLAEAQRLAQQVGVDAGRGIYVFEFLSDLQEFVWLARKPLLEALESVRHPSEQVVRAIKLAKGELT